MRQIASNCASPSRLFRHGTPLGTAGLALALMLTTALAAPGAAAQTPDFIVSKVEVNQALTTGFTTLVGDRPTMVRSSVRMVNGPVTPVSVDAVMHVFDGAFEIAGSPFFSDNGPILVVQPADPGELDHTLNFTFIPPVSDALTISVEINPPGPNHVAESDPANNTHTQGPLELIELGIPDLAYAPIDYRPGGGTTPNLPDPDLIEPGVGDNFVQAIYPVPDLDYRRIDAPSKLWTSSLASTGSSLNNSLTADLALMVPQPDFIYGWVPGGLGYNGQSIINGVASMGNTQPIRHQRTYAHELGHNTGLLHHNGSAGLYGVDVEHHLAITQALPVIKTPNLYDVMVGGQLTNSAWVYLPSYNSWMVEPAFQADTSASVQSDDEDGPVLFVAGVWNTVSGAVRLTDVFELPSGRPSASADGGSEVVLRAWSGGADDLSLVRELAVSALSGEDCSDADAPFETVEVAFQARLPLTGPDGAPLSRLEVLQGGARTLHTLTLERSEHVPEVAFVSPAGAELTGDALRVEWQGHDADGDTLTYYLRYSRDGTQFSPLVSSTRDTAIDVALSRLPRLVDGRGFFELFASDGLHTVRVRTPALTGPVAQAGDGVGNPPWAHLLTPDDGSSFLQGANVLLHAMGWDLEDHSITGGDVVWSSDLDGELGSGRRTSTALLSPGTHVISVTVTDGDGQQSVDSASIEVVARGLPDIGGLVCQTDLGFGGPGSSVLSVCGESLSSGHSADLLLTGGPPSSTAWLVVCTGMNPTPFNGGVLVPSPILFATPLLTDAGGELSITDIPGGNGPASVVIQFVLDDPGEAFGYGISNALRLEFLP